MNDEQAEVRVIPASERSDVLPVASRLPTPRPIPPSPIPAPSSESNGSRPRTGVVVQPLSIVLRHATDTARIAVVPQAAGWVVEVETWDQSSAPVMQFRRLYQTADEVFEIFWTKVEQLQERMKR